MSTRKTRTHRSGAAFVAGFALIACTTVVVHPGPRDATWASEKWPGTTIADLEHGRDVFVSRCSGCHDLPSPGAKKPDEWASVVGEMASGARLSASDQDLVLRYLSAASERLHEGG